MSLQNCLKSEASLGYIVRSCLKVHRWVNKDLTIKVKTTCFLGPGSVVGTDKSNTVSALKVRLKGTRQKQKPEDCVRRQRGAGVGLQSRQDQVCQTQTQGAAITTRLSVQLKPLLVTSSVSVYRPFSSLVWHCPIPE